MNPSKRGTVKAVPQVLGLTSPEVTIRVDKESTRVYLGAYPVWSGSSTTRTTDFPDCQGAALGTAPLSAGYELGTFPFP